MTSVRAGLVLGLLGFGTGLLAQEAPPTFRSGAEIVKLDLVARDGKGAPVTDLREDELQVFEDGAPCEIVSFRLVQARPPAVAARRTAQPAGARGSVPRGTPTRPGLVVLAFDALGSDAARRARRAALELLAKPFPAGTWFAAFKTGQGVQPLGSFTTDPGALATAVRAATTGAEATRDEPMGREEGPASASLTEQAARAQVRRARGIQPEPGEIPAEVLAFIDRARRTQLAYGSLTSLLAIVKALEAVEGRKTIVYFSEGLHVTDDAAGLYDTVVGAANRANVTVYAIDARGLTLDSPQRESQAMLDAAASGSSTPLSQAVSDAVRGNIQANLGRLADETGGFLLANTERLGPALERVAEELGSYYEIGYRPASPVQDGRFRRVQVKVSRRGLTVRTRSGYYATPAAPPALAADELPLVAALESAEARHDFAHHAAVLHFDDRAGERGCVLLLDVPLEAVQLTPDPSSRLYRAHLTLLALVEDENGRLVARVAHDWPLEGPLAEIDRRREGHAQFRHALLLRPGRYTVRTAVHDRDADRLSVARTPIEVPAAGHGVAMSSLAIVRRTETALADATREDPLRMGHVSILPGIGPTITAAGAPELTYFATLYPAAGDEAPDLRLELRRNGEVKAYATPKLPPADADGRIPYLGRVPLERLPPGAYELVLSARQGTNAVEEKATFDIPPPLPAPVAAAPAPEAAPATTPPPADPALADVLRRAGEYVLDYKAAFRVVVAEEYCIQGYARNREAIAGPGWEDELGPQSVQPEGRLTRRTRADLVFARLPGALSWGSFRDVYEVDGVKVRDRDARLERLFRDDPGSAVERARAIVQENARYNIGSARRNINIPTLALLFLHPRNQARFSFEGRGRSRVAEMDTVEVRFVETARPTLVRDSGTGGDLPAEGSFWIDPSRGTVVRTLTRFRFGLDRGSGQITTEYRRDPALRLWLPSEMSERYEEWGVASAGRRALTTSVARYSNFRQFTVTIEDEKARLPPKADEPQPEP